MGGFVIGSQKRSSNSSSSGPKDQPNKEQRKPTSPPSDQPNNPPTDKNPPTFFPIENIPTERKKDWCDGEKKLTSAEEKTIIESLASQVNIDKTKSFFDYD